MHKNAQTVERKTQTKISCHSVEAQSLQQKEKKRRKRKGEKNVKNRKLPKACACPRQNVVKGKRHGVANAFSTR